MSGSTASDLLFGSVLRSMPDVVAATWPVLLLLVLVTAAKWLFRRASVKGWVGERLTSAFSLKGLDAARYRLFEDLYVPRPDGKGTTQIDHVVVSAHGIFVIETKNYGGWIFGQEGDACWTQVLRGKKSRFQNPLRQNGLHVKALAAYLGLPRDVFHSVVFFAGDATFKTPMPPCVLDRGLGRFIEMHRTVVLEAGQVEAAVAILKGVIAAGVDAKCRGTHLANLRRLHGDQGRKAPSSAGSDAGSGYSKSLPS